MRIWVTRTTPQADETAARLRDLGHAPVLGPVLVCRPLDVELEFAGVAALAFTSRNAVTAFTRLSGRRDLPVFTTGKATAADAREAGFAQVLSAEGDVRSLGRLIIARPPAGAVLHLAPKEPAGDLVADLERAGVPARREAIYETVDAPISAPDADAVLIHSPRAGRIVARIAPTALEAFAISPAAAAPLVAANFPRVTAAPYPSEESLLKLIGSKA